jgi:hypothetical protein
MANVEVFFNKISNKLGIKFLESVNSYDELQEVIDNIYKQITQKMTAEELLTQSNFNLIDPLAEIDSVSIMFSDEALEQIGGVALYYSSLRCNAPYNPFIVYSKFSNFEIMFAGARCLAKIFYLARNNITNKKIYN